MGLLYSNYECNPITNNTLKINACSGGIYKTYKESWFTKFNLESKLAEKLFKPYDNKIKTEADTSEKGYDGYYRNVEHKKPVIIIQMIICGDMEVIAELIREEDFIKYFEVENLEKGNSNE
ncbi:MAG: hypothetical protein V8Q75_06350 [Bacilli bacterium]